MNENNETIIYQKRPSWLYYYFLYIVGIILFLFYIKSGKLEGGLFALLFILRLSSDIQIQISLYRYESQGYNEGGIDCQEYQ